MSYHKYKVKLKNNKKVNLNGKEFQYLEIGEKNKDILILVHGWVATKDNWLLNIDKLGEKYRVITFDLPGCNSTDEMKYRLNDKGYTKFLRNFIEASRLDKEKINLVGHSLGSNVTLRYSIEYPDKIEKLILTSLIIKQPTKLDRWLSKRYYNFYTNRFFLYVIKKIKNTRIYCNYIINLVVGKQTQHRKVSADIAAHGIISASPHTYTDGFSSVLGSNNIKLLKNISDKKLKKNIYLIYGKYDKVVGIKNIDNVKIDSNHVIIVKKAGHCVNLEKPSVFNRRVIKIIEGEL